MRYLKKFNESNSDTLVRNLTGEEAKYYIDWKREIITKKEFEKISYIKDKYYKELSQEGTEVFPIKYDEKATEYKLRQFVKVYRVELPISIIKIVDDWWIILYHYNVGAFPDDCTFLCDTIDGVEEWFKNEL